MPPGRGISSTMRTPRDARRRHCCVNVRHFKSSVMQPWPTAVQKTLDDPWTGCFQQLKVRLPGRNHTLDEARCSLFLHTRQAKQAGEHARRAIPLVREGHVVQADPPPGPIWFSHGSPPQARARQTSANALTIFIRSAPSGKTCTESTPSAGAAPISSAACCVAPPSARCHGRTKSSGSSAGRRPRLLELAAASSARPGRGRRVHRPGQPADRRARSAGTRPRSERAVASAASRPRRSPRRRRPRCAGGTGRPAPAPSCGRPGPTTRRRFRETARTAGPRRRRASPPSCEGLRPARQRDTWIPARAGKRRWARSW